MKRILLIFPILFFALSTFAAGHFTFTPKLKDAYNKAMSLRFVEAKQLLVEVQAEDPDNLMVLYVENYIDFLTVYINEDYKEFQRLEPNKEKRINRIERKGDKSSPYYLYTLAEIRLQWAVVRGKFDEYRQAAFEVRRAYLLLEDNEAKFPDFVANKKSLGILHSLVGSIPPNFRWMAKLAGMSGSVQQGQREIKEVVDYAQNHDFIFEDETIIMYSLMMLHINNKNDEAWDIIRNARMNPRTNPMACFAQASVAMHSGRSFDAITILKNRPKGKQYHDFYFLDYMLGLAKLYRQDSDAAFHMNKYVNNFKGRLYIKECHQRIAWHYLLQGDMEGYNRHMNLVKTKGYATSDPDKKALKAANSSEIPNDKILKIRLLFDGGYYDKATAFMNELSEDNFSSEKEKLEFTYRSGRVHQANKNYDQAIRTFNTTIERGQYKSYYFACNAALQAGIIKEGLQDYAAAKVYYNKCLNMSPDEYKNGLHGKAKAALSRIKSK